MGLQRLLHIAALVGCALFFAACGGEDASTDPSVPVPAGGGTSATASDPGTTPTTPPGATALDPSLAPTSGTATNTGLPTTEDGEDVEGLGSLDSSDLFAAKASFEDMPASPETSPQPPLGEAPSGGNTAPPSAPQPSPVRTAYTSAKVSLNGQIHMVKKGTIFPKAEQLFEVTAIDASSITVELVAGEFKNGSTGVTLERGEKLELVNQDEGTTYVLKLVSTAGQAGGGRSSPPARVSPSAGVLPGDGVSIVDAPW